MFDFVYVLLVVVALHFGNSDASVCQKANWWGSFDRRGWSKCHPAYPYINGLYRSAKNARNDGIFRLEEASCCKGSGAFVNQASQCLVANWVHSFDRRKTWNLCPSGYFLSGLGRSGGQNLHNIENAYCCKPRGHANRYKQCYHENVVHKFDNQGWSKCQRPGYYLTGLYRSTCDVLYCIEFFRCCSMVVSAPTCRTAGHTCLNGGQCKQFGSTFKCVCYSGFSGTRCEKREATATCSATGDPHYRTFDKKAFNFMGKCQYVLAKDTGGAFVVQHQNEECNNGASCVRSVGIEVNSLKIRLERGNVVKVFGIVKGVLPYANKGVSITRSGGRVTVQTNIGLTVAYDGTYNVYVTLTQRYRGKTLGLCGNYNGNPNDEYIKKDGKPTGSAEEFGNSWKVDRTCPNSPQPPDPCLNAGSSVQTAKTKCGALRQQPFSQCHKHVQVDDFIKNCEYDVCACKTHPLVCLCEEYAAYADTCLIAQVTVNWKHLAAFRECGSPCASNPCLNDGTCSNNGNTFKCTCPRGYFGSRCEKEVQATCSAYGDPHYRTFDGKRYNFMGVCRYLMAKDKDGTFVVQTRNENCGNGVSCVSAVFATIKGCKIEIERGGHVKVFGHIATLPYKQRGIEIIKLGKTVKITTDIGLNVQYDGVYNVFLYIFGRHMDKVFGLCGNFNGNPNDDFITQDNRQTTDVVEFADSWKFEGNKHCKGTRPSPDPCLNAGSTFQEAKKKCALLKQPPFSQCHSSVNVDDGYIRDCEYDVCACKKHPESCLCEEYAEYTTTCAGVGVNLSWKKLPAFHFCSSPCAAGPCRNGGGCTNQGKGFKCTCLPGYTGKTCEIPDCTSPKPLGVENGKIPDNKITASSQWNSRHGPANGRINFRPQNGRTGAWSARSNNAKQWIQYDLEYEATVGIIRTQGRPHHNQWVKSYTVSYSTNGKEFQDYRQGGVVKVFHGNNDRNTIVAHTLSPVIVARFMRLHPKSWQAHISLRAGFHGCFINQPCAHEPCHNGGECRHVGDDDYRCRCLAGYSGDRCETAECTDGLDLGMEYREIHDSQITASSEWNSGHSAKNARLNFKASRGVAGAWCSRFLNAHQWLQVDFELKATISEILTQGRSDHNQWITSYTVSYSRDGVHFTSYKVDGNLKVFPGNRDRNTIVRNKVSPVIVTRFLRIHPKTWANHISMRAEFVGCIDEWPCDLDPCLNGGTCHDYRGKYFCSCAKGFIGRHCDLKEGDCKNRT